VISPQAAPGAHPKQALLDLAEAVRRLPPPSRLDPERFFLEHDEVARAIRLAVLALRVAT